MSFYNELVILLLPGAAAQSGNPGLVCSWTGRNDRPYQQNRNDQTKVDQLKLLSLTAAKQSNYLQLLQLQPKLRLYNFQFLQLYFMYLDDKSAACSPAVKLLLTPSSIADDVLKE